MSVSAFKELTKAEEEVMQIIWQMEQVYVRDILERLPEPKPAYSTVSTVVRILESKGFVGHEVFGNTYRYYPLVEKEAYTRYYMQSVLKGYFGNSFRNLVSFFVDQGELSLREMDTLLEELKKENPASKEKE